MHSFKNWPAQHRNLLLIVILLAIAFSVVGYVHVYPHWVEYTELRDEKSSIENKLLKSEWPKDPERLKAILAQLTKRLEKDNGNNNGKGLRAETEEVIAKATSMFNDKIVEEYESISFFIQRASQTEYKNQYDLLDSYFQGKNINIDNTVFGMNEMSSEPLKYQMLLKLWTTQAVVDCALQSKMHIMTQRTAGGNHGRPVSMVSVLPMQSYYLNDRDASPYLLEFPVHIELIGSLQNFSDFTDLLFKDGRFLPMTRMELAAVPPSLRNLPKPDGEGNIYSGTVVARVTCSSFFLPQTPPKEDSGSSSSKKTTTARPVGI